MQYGGEAKLSVGVAVSAHGGSVCGDPKPVGWGPKRAPGTDAAGCDRLRQNLYDGEYHRQCSKADSGPGSQQDPGGAALLRVSGIFSPQYRGIFRFLT